MPAKELFDDLAELKAFAAEAGKCERAAIRWCNEPNGLPYVKLGNKRYVHVPRAKDWLLSRLRQPNPRRVAGDPKRLLQEISAAPSAEAAREVLKANRKWLDTLPARRRERLIEQAQSLLAELPD